MTEQTKGVLQLGVQIRWVPWSKEILNGVVMCRAGKPKNHDFIPVLVKGNASTTCLTRVSG